MKKIAVVGSPGSGKSTFARALHDITHIELIHLDVLFWKPGWVETPRNVWIKTQEELIKIEEWIIDGNYQSTIDIRLNAADTIIFLDMPRFLCIWRVIKRHFMYLGKSRTDMAKDCPEKMSAEYIWEVWNFPNNKRKKLIQKLSPLSKDKQLIWLSSSQQIATFLNDYNDPKLLALPHFLC